MSRAALPNLQTSRLHLRERTEIDLPGLIDLEKDPQVVRFLSDGISRTPEQERAHVIERIHRNHGDGYGYWSIFLATAPERFLGWVCLRPLAGYSGIEIGYCFTPAARGCGYVTEAGQRCLDYAFDVLRLVEVVAVIHPDNQLSQRVIARLGFERDGERDAYGCRLWFYRLRRPPTQGVTSD